jgi:hypothetical protein
MKEESPGSSGDIRPVWIRLPKKGSRCPFSGLSRTSLNELILPCEANGGKPPVRSFCQKVRRDQIRGTRLVSYDSLMAYLSAQADKENGCKPPASSDGQTKAAIGAATSHGEANAADKDDEPSSAGSTQMPVPRIKADGADR